jgi:anaerobic glycerol-3-phosphate dehydrogenase
MAAPQAPNLEVFDNAISGMSTAMQTYTQHHQTMSEQLQLIGNQPHGAVIQNLVDSVQALTAQMQAQAANQAAQMQALTAQMQAQAAQIQALTVQVQGLATQMQRGFTQVNAR